jgi:23S rRNA pseudouridine2605 synthase
MEERLQKLIAAAGIASRRHAEDLISSGLVTINGQVITELGTKADPQRDHIKVRGRLINAAIEKQEKVYILLNKPRGYLSSLADPEGRPLVVDLLPAHLGRLHPVGRLDFNTEGLLLLTNDGDFTNRITSARNQIAKVYEAKVKGIPSENAIERLRRGVTIEPGQPVARADVREVAKSKTNSWFEVTLHEGRNQQIRRMFDAIGYSVIKLKRVRIGTLKDDKLPSGRWRYLNELEVKRLMREKKKVSAGANLRRARRPLPGRRRSR